MKTLATSWIDLIGYASKLGPEYKGVGGTIPTPMPFGMTKTGPFADFQSTRSVGLQDFEGKANVYQDPSISVGPSFPSSSRVHLAMSSARLVQQQASLRPSIVPLETGWALGLTILAVSSGALQIKGGINPWTGP